MTENKNARIHKEQKKHLNFLGELIEEAAESLDLL